MGTRKSRHVEDFESPRRKVYVSEFQISRYAVSNAQYAKFVCETGYRTVAEREGWSFVFHLLLQRPQDWIITPQGLPWWRKVEGACWKSPEGPNSDFDGREDHPVVHISWHDAEEYCRWAGLRLPYEAEWEKAATGGLKRCHFPWGNELTPGGRHKMNVWQGEFPRHNSQDDGYLGTSPVNAYDANAYGLFNMSGNVWEWVQDWFSPSTPSTTPVFDPKGPEHGLVRVQKGGSFLCHASYCDRYHVYSRTRNEPSSSSSNTGFRVAW